MSIFPEHQAEAGSENLGAADGLDFDAILADAQPRIRGYLASILGGWADVDDLLQDTNLVLIQKRNEFRPGTNFIAWAFRVAYFKATTWRRDRSREGRVVLRENEFQEIAAAAEQHFAKQPSIIEALNRCVARLPDEDQELIRIKYVEKRSLASHAAAIGCRPNSLHKSISRLRLVLRNCVRKSMASHPGPNIIS